MPRTSRSAAGGVVNRGNGRMGVFRKPGDYAAFLRILLELKGEPIFEPVNRHRDEIDERFGRGVAERLLNLKADLLAKIAV
jgi:hypothetical protein